MDEASGARVCADEGDHNECGSDRGCDDNGRAYADDDCDNPLGNGQRRKREIVPRFFSICARKELQGDESGISDLKGW